MHRQSMTTPAGVTNQTCVNGCFSVVYGDMNPVIVVFCALKDFYEPVVQKVSSTIWAEKFGIIAPLRRIELRLHAYPSKVS